MRLNKIVLVLVVLVLFFITVCAYPINYQVNEEYSVEGIYSQTSYLGFKNYKSGNEFLPIETNIVASSDPLFDYEVTKGVYQSYFKENPTEGQVVKFVISSEYITYQPMALNYRNDLSQLQQINMIQEVIGVANSNNFLYEAAYGIGMDLQYSYFNDYLREELIINSFSDLAIPEQYIIDGGNTTLDLDFILTTNSNKIVIDGVIWDKSTPKTTSNEVFIKNEEDNIIYYLKKPYAYDSNGAIQLLTYNFRKSGQSLFVTVKTPYSWISNPSRVYPIYIDPDTGASSPGTMAEDAAVGTQEWNNENFAKVSDDDYAYADSLGTGTKTYYLKATNFGFNITEFASVDGILVEIERHESGSGRDVFDDEVKIVKSDGSIGAEDKSLVPRWNSGSDPDTYESYGANDDLWSESWESSNINNPNFGVVVSAIGGSGATVGVATVDHIRITVYYTSTNISPDINLLAPDGSQYVGGTDVNISFNVQDEDLGSTSDGDLYVDIYYSTAPDTFENLIISDLNLSNDVACDDSNFTITPTHCTYFWNTDGNSIADGNYYIDLNVHDDSDANAISASAATFFLDNSKPDIYIWQPQADGIDSNTLVTFDVNENSLVTNVAVKINSQTSGDFSFATHCALFDINYHCQYVETGFVPNNDNNLSILATNTIGDTNQSDLNFVLNTQPTITLLNPDGAQYVGLDDINISFQVRDTDLNSEATRGLYADIYYSASAGAFTTSIVDGIDLFNTAVCDDQDFSDATNCYFPWNSDSNSIADGNYFLDVNIFDQYDYNAQDSSATSFFLDNSKPDIYIWKPLVNEVTDSTTITFDVNENSLISTATVKINGVASGDFTFGTDCTNFDINYHCSYSETNFVPNHDNNISILATNIIGDTNQSDLNFVYNRAPTITIQAPNGNQYIGGDDLNISFRVTDSDLNGEFLDELFVTLAYSPASGVFTNTIVAKLDLFTADCDSNVFSGGVNCTYEWDANAVADGNYFIDGNVFDRYDFNAQDSSAASFFMDNSAPDIFISRPAQGTTVSARQIDFSVLENGMVGTITTLINGTASTIFSRGSHCTLVDINYYCSYVEGAVIPGDNNITIRALNTGGGDDLNEVSHTFVFNDPSPGTPGGTGGIGVSPPSPEKRFEVVSIPETLQASRGIGTEFRITVKNISNEELTNFEIRFNEEIAPLINTISVPEVIGAGQIEEFVYRITPEEDSESQSLVVFFFDGSFADSQEISVLVIDNLGLALLAALNSPAFNFGESVINWNILLFAIVTAAFIVLLVLYPQPKQLIAIKVMMLIALGALLISAVAGA